MITIFEDFQNNNVAEIGDWVICTAPSYIAYELKEFLNNKIGKLIGKNNVYWKDDGDIVKNPKILIEYSEMLPKGYRNVLEYASKYKNFSYSELLKNNNIKLNNIDNCIWLDEYYITSYNKDRIVLEVKIDREEYNL